MPSPFQFCRSQQPKHVGVTKAYVVRRGALQQAEARERKKDVFASGPDVQGGAGGGKQPRSEASLKTRVSVVRFLNLQFEPSGPSL